MALSSYVILSAATLHVLTNSIALIGILVIKDYTLINLFEENHLVGLVFLVLFVVDAKFILLINSGTFFW